MKFKKILFIVIIGTLFLVVPFFVDARSGCCSHHGGVCGCSCCDGTPLSATCAPYYPECNKSYSSPSPAPIIETEYNNPAKDLADLEEETVSVVSITDGDTIKVSFEAKLYPVRIIGIDTPESKDPRKPVECFAKESADKLSDLIMGKKVVLKKDKINDNIDIYDRLLRHIYLDGVNIAAEMIKQGYAYAYLKYNFEQDKMDSYKQYEREAREKEVGLWAAGICGNPIEIEENDNSIAGIATKTLEMDEEEQVNIKQDDNGNKNEDRKDNPTNTSDDFSGGFFAGSIFVLVFVLIWKLIKKTINRFKKKNE